MLYVLIALQTCIYNMVICAFAKFEMFIQGWDLKIIVDKTN